MRNFLGQAIAPILKITGFRFSKQFRYDWEKNTIRGFIYRNVDTVGANIKADGN